MRLTVAGCGDAFGSGGRANTCFWIEGGGEGALLLDAGATALPSLRRLGLDPARIDAVVLSHLHGDHFGGLPFLILDADLVTRRTRPLPILGPPGLSQRLPALTEAMFPGAFANPKRRYALELVELPPGTPGEVAGFGIATTEVIHPSGAPSTAVRLERAGRVLAYSGDTQWTDALVGVAEGADLLILECYGWDRPIPYHLGYTDLLARAPSLKAGRILLTHLGPEAVRRIPEIDRTRFTVAEDGLVLDV